MIPSSLRNRQQRSLFRPVSKDYELYIRLIHSDLRERPQQAIETLLPFEPSDPEDVAKWRILREPRLSR